MSFGVSCHFISFGVSCHLAFHVIWRFMSFGVSCHLAFHVILAIIVIIVTKVLNGINAKVGVLKKWLPEKRRRFGEILLCGAGEEEPAGRLEEEEREAPSLGSGDSNC